MQLTCLAYHHMIPLTFNECGSTLGAQVLQLRAGATLQCYHLRRPGQAASAPRVLHRLAPDDAFVALACPVSGGGSAAYTGGQSSSFPHLLAASTLREVLLLDLRRPGRALLKWAHGATCFGSTLFDLRRPGRALLNWGFWLHPI